MGKALTYSIWSAPLDRTIRFFLLVLLSSSGAYASDVIDVRPLTNQVLMIHFDDGYVDHHELGEPRENETLYHIPLNVTLADQLASYTIRSSDDAAYAAGLLPIDLSRKSKGTDYQWLCLDYSRETGCSQTADDHAKEHWLYLFLPEPMQNGKTYTVDLGELAENGSTFSVTYHDDDTRSEAVHVNNVGYDPAANAKYGYVYHWIGTKGGLDLSSYAGAPFQLINQQTGNADFTGTLTFRKGSDNQEMAYTSQTPDGNLLGAEVYECDFSGFGGTGTYVLSVDGIGCSFPFKLNSNVYDEVFYWTMKGLYQNRSGIALEAAYTNQPRPADHNPNITPGFQGKLKYTSTRYYDVSNSDADQKDRSLWEAGIKGDINTWGWYHDAGDWDAYSTHSRVPANLMFLYEAAAQNFDDGQLNIPESGNGLPDLLDEARWLIRFYHRTRQAILEADYGTGGVGGTRVFGDLWGKDYREDGTTVGSWQDTHRMYVVSGEDPHMTYTYAGLAAQYAWILAQGGFTDPEGIDWKQEAQEAWTWAKNNTKPGDEVLKFNDNLDLVASRMYAATALYRLTGNSEYQTQFVADVATKAWTPTTVLQKDNRYSAWIYSLTENPTKNSATAELVQSTALHTADFIMLYHVDKRACRWAGNYWHPLLVGHGTTPMVNEGVMGYAIAQKAGTNLDKLTVYKLFMQTTADYFLGTNPLNMTWLTGVGDRSPSQIFHLDSWYTGDGTPRKGIIPYGPWHNSGSSLGPLGPWNHKWAHKTLTPSDVDQWPGHERWFSMRTSPSVSEFTIHENNGVAAVVYGFLKNGPGSYRGGENDSPTTSLSAPTSLTATVTPSNTVRLRWTDNSNNESGFRIERQVNNGSYQQINSVAANSTAYNDDDVAAGATYAYRVSAFNASGASEYSNVVYTEGSSATAYRYLRLTFEAGKDVSVQEVSWLAGGTVYPLSALTVTGQPNAQGAKVLGASYEYNYRLYNKLDNCTGGHFYIGNNLPETVILDLGEGNAIVPEQLIISKCSNNWSELSRFKAEGSADQSEWVLLQQFDGLTTSDFPGDVGTFSLNQSTSARQATGISHKAVVAPNAEAIELKVFPNPSTGIVQVLLPEAAQVQVHNSLGQLVLEQNVPAGQSSLDLSKTGHGMHLLSTKIQGQRQVRRLVLQ